MKDQSGSNASFVLSDKNHTITINEAKVNERVSFLDYIMGGTEICVHVAIDYTLSNGPVNMPDSLHYLNPKTSKNKYTDALYQVVNILQNYSSNHMFPVYGFGGVLPMSK
jgi:hypothetical protein